MANVTYHGTVQTRFFPSPTSKGNPDNPFMTGLLKLSEPDPKWGASIKFTAPFVADKGDKVELTGQWHDDDRWGWQFRSTGGFVKPIGVDDFRAVTAQSGDVLTLLLPFKQSVLSQTVDAFAGCNRIIDEDCLLVFNNPEEHGGWPFIPKKNPIGGNILVT